MVLARDEERRGGMLARDERRVRVFRERGELMTGRVLPRVEERQDVGERREDRRGRNRA
jgi:hypothetical protein